MGRQWFASSVHGLAGVVSLILAAFLLSGVAPSPSPSSSFAQQDFLLLPAFDLEWVTPPQGVRVGDRLTAKLAASGTAPKLSPDFKVEIPPQPEGGDPEDLGFAADENLKASQDGSEFQISVIATKAGHVTVPSLALQDSSGKAVARTNPISFDAASSISKDDPKPKEAEPPKPPVSLALPILTLIVLGILLLGLIAGGIAWLVRWSRKRRASIVMPPEPAKPEDEVAFAALASLEKKGLIKSGQFKAHYFSLSEIIKHYLGARFSFDAAESTTYELICALEEKNLLTSHALGLLREIFERLDRVKFTDHVPVAIEGTELLEEARKLVMITRRPPPAAVTAGAPDAAR